MSSAQQPQSIPTLGPVHPDFVDKLVPEYVAFHNEHLTSLPALPELPWDPRFRSFPAPPGNTPPQQVGSIKDISLSRFKIRVFTPDGPAPTNGWPALLFFHGGGWTLGNINTENSLCTILCNRARGVVVSVDYRLAPENPYPAAVEDSIEALRWLYEKGRDEIDVDSSRLAVGGSSSGGNLAAIAALKAAEMQPPIPLIFQMLIVPVTDNTASEDGTPHASWAENANTAWLNIARMMWFRRNYLPNPADWTRWDSSPIFAPDNLIQKVPTAWIACMECDILRDEAIAYADKLRAAGVKAHVEVYKGAPHQLMVLDGLAIYHTYSQSITGTG
ncbi:lipase/ esterase [Punctularia strigosozonata HHB-11173 SS5]|uniref:lipase/ esterase n=1 Tax=Punctularia strigosozonata (strain HHB-11173) TaxID=741275 RepID=UPI0004416510|nr:lipase/ esterase [Punctularia strigosozonata HHB-11173 SS5]EIN13786.1 lipase/ esterase [Punctularia strigosozonata HHB-11173 SS5]